MICRILFFVFSFITVFGCAQKSTSSEEVNKSEKSFKKINGVSFVASPKPLKKANIVPIVNINAEYAAIMPFGFIKNLEHPEIVYNQERQWFGETMEGTTQYVNRLHEYKMKVMIKPQIWVWRGEFTGLLKMATEEDWIELENSYRDFIIDFATLAGELNVELFCIGTELEKFIEHRPEYWTKLIAEIRTVYSGKLTYAANWDEYKRVPFWKDLDYIGVDAYFPVSDEKNPTLKTAREGWQKWKKELKGVSKREGKKILFAEYGYRSVDFSGKEPWKSDREMTAVNLEAQNICLQAMYEEVWNEDWFAGGFLWKWFIAHYTVGGEEDSQFTPQNKPAEDIVKKYYEVYQ